MQMEKTNVSKGVLWNTIGTIYYYFCQWIITILIVRLTDYSLAGYLSLAITVTNSFYAVAQFGMRQYQVSDIQGKYDDSIYIGSRYITIVVAFFACLFFSLIKGYDSVQVWCIGSYMLLKAVEAYVDVCQGIAQKAWRFDIIGISLFIRGTFLMVGFGLLIYFTGNLPFTLIVISIISFVGILVIDVRLISNFASMKCRIFDRRIFRLIKECIPIVGFNFLLSFVTLIAREGLQDRYGIEALGIYSSVASPTVIIQLLASVIFNPFIPFFAEYYNNKKVKDFFSLMIKFVLMLVGITGAAIISAYFFGKWALIIIIGQQIAPYCYLLIPVIGCTVVTAAIWLFAGIMIAMRRTVLLLLSTIAGLLTDYCIIGHMLEKYYMNGASYSIIIAGFVQIVIMVLICITDMIFRGRRNV